MCQGLHFGGKAFSTARTGEAPAAVRKRQERQNEESSDEQYRGIGGQNVDQQCDAIHVMGSSLSLWHDLLLCLTNEHASSKKKGCVGDP
jgi:hypothetical protein